MAAIQKSDEKVVRAGLEERRARLASAEYRADLSDASFKGESTKLRNAEARLEALSELTGPQAIDSQLEMYGRERWKQEFVLLSEVPSPSPRVSAEAHQQALHRAMPASKFQFFQELFVAPEKWIAPRSAFVSANPYELAKDVIRRSSVLACLVDPNRIPDDFVHRLGLASLVNEKNRPLPPMSRLERKAGIEVLSGLKLYWDASAPLSQGRYRVLVLSQPTDGLLQRYQGHRLPGSFIKAVTHPAPLPHLAPPVESEGVRRYKLPAQGQLFVSYCDPGTEQRVLQLFADARSARRRFDHVLRLYDAEVHSISGVQAAISPEIVSLFCSADERVMAQQVLSTASQELGAPRSRPKVSAQLRLGHASTGKDSRGRNNPMIAASRAKAANRDLDQRVDEATSIISHLKADSVQLQHWVEQEAQTLNSYFHCILQTARALPASPQLFGSRLFPDSQDEVVRDFLSQCRICRSQVGERVRLSPYQEFMKAIKVHEAAFASALRVQDRPTAEKHLDALLGLGIAFQTYERISKMKLSLSEGHEDIVQTLLGAARALNDQINKFQELILCPANQSPRVTIVRELVRNMSARLTRAMKIELKPGEVRPVPVDGNELDTFIAECIEWAKASS